MVLWLHAAGLAPVLVNTGSVSAAQLPVVVGATVLVLRALAKTLIATIAIETLVACVAFGVRDLHDLEVVALAQVVTNPIVELAVIATGWDPSLPLLSGAWLTILALELAAFAVEGWLYERTGLTSRPWLFSAALNVTSFCIGLLLAYMA